MAMQPQQPPAQSPPDQGQGGDDDSGSVQQLVEDIYTDLLKFHDMVAQASPDLAQKLEAVTQGFQAVVEALVKGGGAQGQPPPQGPKGPSAGGPGAVPM